MLPVPEDGLEDLKHGLAAARWPAAWPGAEQRSWAAGTPLAGVVPVHQMWHQLMHDELGFTRYGAHGSDLGAGVTSLLAQDHPDAVVGIHLLSIAEPRGYDPGSLTPDEQQHLDALNRWFAEEGAYEHQQMTRPVTLGYGLSDSPAGLLAWMVEKYWAWSDHGGQLSSVFSDDDILTQASATAGSRWLRAAGRPARPPRRGSAR